jgi:hypothetical protein
VVGNKLQIRVVQVLVNAMLLFAVFLLIMPYLYMISASFKEGSEIFSIPIKLLPDGLYMSLAVVTTRPGGRVGISHLTHHQLGPEGLWGEAASFDELYESACANLASGLRIDEYDNGVLDMHRDGGLAAPAVGLPDFHASVSGLVGSERFVVGITCPQHLVIAAEGSAEARTIRSMVMESDYPTSESVPCLLRVDRRGITLAAERR